MKKKQKTMLDSYLGYCTERRVTLTRGATYWLGKCEDFHLAAAEAVLLALSRIEATEKALRRQREIFHAWRNVAWRKLSKRSVNLFISDAVWWVVKDFAIRLAGPEDEVFKSPRFTNLVAAYLISSGLFAMSDAAEGKGGAR